MPQVNHFGINKSLVDRVKICDVLKDSKVKSVETEVIGSHTGDSPAARVLNATVSTEISVADLLEAVKENCPEFTEINVLSPHPMTGVVLTRKNEGNQFCRS